LRQLNVAPLFQFKLFCKIFPRNQFKNFIFISFTDPLDSQVLCIFVFYRPTGFEHASFCSRICWCILL
jgi:hypothetical protein